MKKTYQIEFDFKNFSARVAELNRLHKELHDLSELRLRTGKEEDIARWELAVNKWKEFSGFFGCGETKFYFFENRIFLAALSEGESNAKEIAIKFLEFDPYYYRSGYIKSKLLVRLKRLKLTASEVRRLQKVVCNAILSPLPKIEFKDYARLLKNIGTPELFQKIQDMSVPDLSYLQDRKSCCLQKVYWKSSNSNKD